MVDITNFGHPLGPRRRPFGLAVTPTHLAQLGFVLSFLFVAALVLGAV